ncbi:hypothetical protein FNW02_16825 [Komarekiella sp. 'clone 1']|uniref:Uncharacterized protein n=1 Tax=Komarekiella delphini-convector SJRDD-AB1 TaxID=2593771 RepID=A0AA40VRZ9_9NOST|nr:hypothetical protein [Komarekiella delphini-convector]MBD6617447.1 hypothetical protein [Komarekiella delphini-convector SJRDD-AB1]
MTFQELRELLIKQTGWNIDPINNLSFLLIKELEINWDCNVEPKNNEKRLIKYYISFEIDDFSSKIKSLKIRKFDSFQPYSIKTRIFYINETYNIDTIVDVIKKEIPFDKADPIPRIFY